jgi:tetratricopeptide (TPR) repeat protein
MFNRKNSFKANVLLIALLALGIAVAGCEKGVIEDDEIGGKRDLDLLIDQGWDELNGGNADAAVTLFSDVIRADAQYLDGYLGLGHAYAKLNQVNRALQNISIALDLSVALVDLNAEYRETIRAEGYIAGASAMLASLDYEGAIEYALEAVELWETETDPAHRYLTDFGMLDLKMLLADAYYADQQYHEAMLIVEEYDNTYIGTANHIYSRVDTVTVDLRSDTWATGAADLELPSQNIVYVAEVADMDGLTQTVLSFDMGGTSVEFRANPVPTAGDEYRVDYYYADDFGLFLIGLRDKLSELASN